MYVCTVQTYNKGASMCVSAYCVCERRGGKSKREGEKEGGRACVCVCV